MPTEAIGGGREGAAITTDADLQRELWGWAAIAVTSLAVAGAFALLLAISRVPGIEGIGFWPLDFFHKGLIIHVVFSFVVWFLAIFAAMAVVATRTLSGGSLRLPAVGLIALSGAVAALPMLFVPALLERGQPTLNNYVPVIIDPLYYAGLAALAISVGLVATRLLATTRYALLRSHPAAAVIAAAALACVLSLLCFALAASALRGTLPSFDFNEALMWGGGHSLQFVNTLLLLVAWTWLAQPSMQRVPVVALALASAMLLLGAVTAPLLYAMQAPFSAEQTQAFSNLQYLLGPAASIVAAALAARLPRPWPWREPACLAMGLSMLLFAVGGTLGLFVDGADTRTPAHYHGVIAGITLAFFGLFFGPILTTLARRPPSARRQRLILHLFAWGQLAACIGLFIAGGHGAPRKVAGDAQGLVDLVPMIGMALNGGGGLVAVVGGVLFVWSAAWALGRAAQAKTPVTGEAMRV